MRINLLLILSSLFLVAACGNKSEQGMDDNTTRNNIQPINYETPSEQRNRVGVRDKSIGELGGYEQSEQEYVNEGDKNFNAKNEDRYTSEQTYLISEYLSERKEVIQTQVAETDDRIIIGVMTGNQDYPDLPKIIEKDVKQIVPNKQVVVYTDKAWWDRMRNLNNSPQSMNQDVERYFNHFFGND